MIHIEFFVAGEPIPQSRPRRNPTTGAFYSNATPALKAWKEAISMTALSHKPNELVAETPIHIRLDFRLPLPKTIKGRRGKVEPWGRPDVDNLAKAVYDAIEGIIYANDSQITVAVVRKRWEVTCGRNHLATEREPPGVGVVIEWFGDPDKAYDDTTRMMAGLGSDKKQGYKKRAAKATITSFWALSCRR